MFSLCCILAMSACWFASGIIGHIFLLNTEIILLKSFIKFRQVKPEEKFFETIEPIDEFFGPGELKQILLCKLYFYVFIYSLNILYSSFK